MDPATGEASRKTSTQRQRPIFSTRTPTEDDARLAPTDATALSPEEVSSRLRLEAHPNPYEPVTSSSTPQARQHARIQKLRDAVSKWWHRVGNSDTGTQATQGDLRSSPSRTEHIDTKATRNRPGPTNHEDSGKLGTVSGVFVPTTLNVLSILLFLRFGFILGQSGVLGMFGMLIGAYVINLLTTMSISAIATNGTVRGGGAYYLISRSLGPEFGGSIGIVFYMGFVFNTAMNALGLIDCLVEVFGIKSGSWSNFIPEGIWWQYLWATVVLVICTAICLAGSSFFSKASNGLLIILIVATFSIPFSAIFRPPFTSSGLGIEFTGIRWRTFLQNLKPRLTKGAAGSDMKTKENFQDLFGILFPATSGIFAGASMSGDLKNPSKSIPKGTLAGILLTFFTYALVILSMAASITRESMYNNVNVIQLTNISGVVVLLGEFAASFFSSLMGVIGSAKLLQAIARDHLFPGLSIFGKGSKSSNEPVYAIFLTFIVTQIALLFDLNKIASFITMTYLMTFFATNLACFLLKIGSAPNFRPSFHYFNWQTAAAGALLSAASMFFVDGFYATGCVALLIVLFLLVHYTSPPKSWGDVSQNLIYHQVRKYLLRLRQEHVKFWRPQILLFVNDFEAQYKIIHFCNSLKKGGLFVLGHVIVTEEFNDVVPETRRQQVAWTKFVEFSKIKAFANISVAPTAEWGVRNIVLTSGLGGMRPNIVVLDRYRPDLPFAESFSPHRRRESSTRRLSSTRRGSQPTSPAQEPSTGASSIREYLTILDDLLFKLRINVAVARGFENMEVPSPSSKSTKRFIDLWPIQMSAELSADGESKRNVLTTNFDTYTLILQLGCILHTVRSWRRSYSLRVVVFVEYETDIEEERVRVGALLEKLRIEAEVVVFSLASGRLKTYQVIVNGDVSPSMHETWNRVNTTLRDESWWDDIQKVRSSRNTKPSRSEDVGQLLGGITNWPGASFQDGGQKQSGTKFEGLKKRLMKSVSHQRRRSISSLRSLNVNLGMQTHRLLDTFVDYESDDSGESTTDESDFEPYHSDRDTAESDNNDDTDIPPLERSNRESSSRTEPTEQAQSAAAQQTPSHSESLQKPSDAESSSTATQAREVPANDLGHPVADPADQVTYPSQDVPTDSTASEEASTPAAPQKRPTYSRSASTKRFSSSPIPEARVDTSDEGAGRSIMFTDSPTARTSAHQGLSTPPKDSIYSRAPTLTSPGGQVASGFPSQAAIPLSFNDLPCRAQHLILNELMTQHSRDTAVMFTTLPSPGEGTCLDKAESEAYLSDLEVLCEGLPPCLLVHSNSMTVTMNL